MLRTIWANKMNFVINHAPGVRSITHFIDLQSSSLPPYYIPERLLYSLYTGGMLDTTFYHIYYIILRGIYILYLYVRQEYEDMKAISHWYDRPHSSTKKLLHSTTMLHTAPLLQCYILLHCYNVTDIYVL